MCVHMNDRITRKRNYRVPATGRGEVPGAANGGRRAAQPPYLLSAAVAAHPALVGCAYAPPPKKRRPARRPLPLRPGAGNAAPLTWALLSQSGFPNVGCRAPGRTDLVVPLRGCALSFRRFCSGDAAAPWGGRQPSVARRHPCLITLLRVDGAPLEPPVLSGPRRAESS